MKAILSVFDKTGVSDMARALHEAGYELVSTGTTGGVIAEAGLPVTQVSDLTGSPELLDGRVKTLHPKIHAGILARRDLESHAAQLAEHGIDTIDVVVGNLYPFVETVSNPDVTLSDALENIDIGGPTLIRAASKNFPHVTVVVDPADYEWVGQRLAGGQELSLEERRGLAFKAFQHVALYDTAIARYLADGDPFTDEFTLGFTRVSGLRYGENPHQQASLYRSVLSSGGIVAAEQLHGPEISYNNVMDADAAWTVVSDFAEPAAAIVKHNNPCGLAAHDDQPTAYQRALEGDPVSAYGGIVAVNRTLTAATATAMKGTFYEIVVAPDYEPAALEVLRKRKKTRVLQVPPAKGPTEALDLRKVSGGALLQTVDAIEEDPSTWEVVTERKPTGEELADLAFAWKAAKHIKSNTIVLARDRTMVGMGAGQPNRVTSVHLALRIAGDKSKDSVLASDAFMPFADNVELAAKGGVVAIAQPGGSMRDQEVIEAADRLGIAMVFTGTRHFRH
ncbi:MAG: bifunctional phosphoribosylaminoimidazolecarboxamide formyltransferase/IMP cyclohydrolase [Chloroflexi bacterium]|nr:bifunctional phosphoribosylaminoimidazolecarboxamide formyltransferase/IMP cyclohydrolase [Chloroflexota bacterium]